MGESGFTFNTERAVYQLDYLYGVWAVGGSGNIYQPFGQVSVIADDLFDLQVKGLGG